VEVILTKPVEHLGTRGAIVKVADGFGRNWLLPQGLAMIATPGAKKQAAAFQRAEARREQQRRDHAGLERDRIHGKAVTVRARATAAGKLYGSVTAKDICEALRQTHGLSVDPERCRLSEHHLRDLGSHIVPFQIYHDIAAEVTVTVKPLDEPAEAAPQEEAVKRAPKPKPIITGGAVED
jgi:large subunit ribosomal protein L9